MDSFKDIFGTFMYQMLFQVWEAQQRSKQKPCPCEAFISISLYVCVYVAGEGRETETNTKRETHRQIKQTSEICTSHSDEPGVSRTVKGLAQEKEGCIWNKTVRWPARVRGQWMASPDVGLFEQQQGFRVAWGCVGRKRKGWDLGWQDQMTGACRLAWVFLAPFPTSLT